MSSTGLIDQRFIKNSSIGTDEAIAGFIAATAAGRALMATGLFDSATFSDKVAAGAVALSKLAEAVLQADGGQALTANWDVGGTFRIRNLPMPLLAGDVASMAYVDQQVTAGKAWREALLVSEQLRDGIVNIGAVRQAIAIALTSTLTNNDTLVITDGSNTETFTFKTSPAGAFQVQIGGSALATQNNLISKINTDSLYWRAVGVTGLDDYFPSQSIFNEAVIYRLDQTGDNAGDDRVYGTLAGGQNELLVHEFATGSIDDYSTGAGVESNLPSVDPAAKRFGFGRAFANIHTSETHITINDQKTYTWDKDNDAWEQTDGGSVLAGSGLQRIANTISVKPDVTTGGDVAPVTAGANGTGLNVNALDGDHLDITFFPTNYIPTTTGVPEAANTGDLAAHLKGIDNKFGTVAAATTARQESVTTQNITGTNTAMTDTLDFTPETSIGVKIFLNGMLMRQGFHYSISGVTITWLALSSGFNQLSTDIMIAVYRSV